MTAVSGCVGKKKEKHDYVNGQIGSCNGCARTVDTEEAKFADSGCRCPYDFIHLFIL